MTKIFDGFLSTQRLKRTFRPGILLFSLCIFLVSCAPIPQNGQLSVDRLEPFQESGQTIVPLFAGFSAIDIYLGSGSPGDGQVVLELKDSEDAQTVLASASVPLSNIKEDGYYTFLFSPQPDSKLNRYYFTLSMQGSGSPSLGIGSGGSYSNGSLYRDGRPVDGTLAFKFHYSKRYLVAGLLQEFSGWIKWVVLYLLFFVVPGLVFLSLWKPRISWTERFALGSGVCAALYPLLMVWLKLTGLSPGAGFAWGLLGVSATILIWRVYRKEIGFSTAAIKAWRVNGESLPDALLLAVTLVLLFTRLWAFRSAAGPFWGDSVQHTVIAQLIMNNGGLFDNWEPYAPYYSLTVQYGFSSGAAVFGWLSGLSGVNAALVFGQLLNAFAVIAWYPFGRVVSRGNKWAGLLAVVIAGLVTPIPGMYSNWGRYAQLAGQTILPLVCLLTWDMLHSKRGSVKQGLFLGSLLAGMLLCYYRMAIYYGIFVLVFMAVYCLEKKPSLKDLKTPLLQLIIAAVSTVIFIAPWIIQVSGSDLAGDLESGISQAPLMQGIISDYQIWKQILDFVPSWLLAVTGTGAAFSLLKKNWLAAGIFVWFLILSAVRFLAVVRLPGANMLQSTAVVYSLYIPTGLISGYILGELLRWIQTRARLGGIIAGGVVILLAVPGAISQAQIAQPDPFYSLITWPDLTAMQWIRENTPQNAVFLVEGFRAHEGTAPVGSDAGWWLPLLTDRKNTMPPQYALGNEKPIPENYSANVGKLVQELETVSLASEEGAEIVCRWGITHVYIGQKQGLASWDQVQLFTAQELDESPYFTQIYVKDRVRIYQLNTDLCPE